MAAIDISSAGGGGSVSTGVLQLQNGVAMDSTLRSVTDQNNTASTLKLSTTSAQFTSPLRITTDDPSDMYLDCEDGSANNRFNITRNTASQQVNLNFASNPGGSTTVVGGIRTYVDGVNLTEVMKFREDGQLQIGSTSASAMYWDNVNNRLGIGTNAPTQTLDVRNTGTAAIFNVQNNAGGFSFGVDSAGGYGQAGTAGKGVAFYNNAGTSFLSISGSGGTGINILNPSAAFHIKGSGSTSATTSLLVQNSGGSAALTVLDDLSCTLNSSNSGAVKFSLGANSLNINFIANNSGWGLIAGGGVRHYISSAEAARLDQNGAWVVGKGSNADASAITELISTTKGFLPPRMTDAQRAAIASPAEGLLVYNTDNHAVAYRDGTNWGYLCGALQNQTGSGGTLAISFASGNIVNLTLNASTTLTFAGHVVGTYIIEVTQGGAGSNTLTYPASVKWSGGTAPTLTTTVGKTDILTFYHDGTNFFGTYSLNY